MSLVLTLESGPRSQARNNARLDEGELVIGRGPEANWRIDDPDMFVSRAHCRITGGPDGYLVTDMSSSGLFIDDANYPLGAGNSAKLQNGMRLRLGDYVVWVDLDNATTRPEARPAAANASRAPASLGGDDFFSLRVEEEPKPPRPASLPNPFEQPEAGAYSAAADRAESRSSDAFDDPFSLDPLPSVPARQSERSADRERADPFGLLAGTDGERGTGPETGGGNAGGFSFDAVPAPPSQPENQSFGFGFDPPVPTPTAPEHPPWLDIPEEAFPAPPPAAFTPAAPPPAAPPPAAPKPAPPPAAAKALPSRRQQAIRPPAFPSVPVPGLGDAALREAFLRGLGVDPGEAPPRDAAAEMERFGREYRLMMEGLMQLLRKRAEEKGNARVAQTVVGASEVNPLKFLPGVDDALAAIMAERSPGFLRGENAIVDAVRDLAEHHVRAWRGIQKALRRMIDRFDPAAIEKELEAQSAVGTLFSGGRSAMLWKLYAKRHREIAASAESRFMGEAGADFRDAYEED